MQPFKPETYEFLNLSPFAIIGRTLFLPSAMYEPATLEDAKADFKRRFKRLKVRVIDTETARLFPGIDLRCGIDPREGDKEIDADP